MSRVAPIQNIHDTDIADMLAISKKMMGFKSVDTLIMAHQPEMLKSSAAWIQTILRGGNVDPGLKRMIGYICSTSYGCTYCSAHTTYTAIFYNVDEEKMKEAWTYETSALFSDQEKAALNLALRSSQQPNQSTDEDFDRLRKYFSEEEIVEIVFTISMYAFLNRFNSTMQTELEEAPRQVLASLKL